MQTPPPYETKFPSLNMPNVVPRHFADTWQARLETWGGAMKQALVSLLIHPVLWSHFWPEVLRVWLE